MDPFKFFKDEENYEKNRAPIGFVWARVSNNIVQI
jgi:hypothetical protein